MNQPVCLSPILSVSLPSLCLIIQGASISACAFPSVIPPLTLHFSFPLFMPCLLCKTSLKQTELKGKQWRYCDETDSALVKRQQVQRNTKKARTQFEKVHSCFSIWKFSLTARRTRLDCSIGNLKTCNDIFSLMSWLWPDMAQCN